MSSTSVLICTADHNVVLLGPINYPVDEDPALLSHPSSSPPQAAPPAPNLTHLRTLLQQLDDVGWDRAALSADLTSVTLRLVDAGGRHHNAVVHLPAGFPTAPPTVALPLPTPFKVRWLPGDSLTTLVSQLEKVSLPAPKPGAPKGCAAVLAVAGGAHHQLAPQEGTTSQAGDDSDSLTDQEEEDGEPGACAICYALHLPDPSMPDEIGAAPSVTCPAALCGRAFHAACLAEWLGALPSSRRVFDTIFGCCPFCQGPIGVSTRLATS